MGLSVVLTAEYGKGFEFRNLYGFLQFYREYPILQSLIAKSRVVLPWTHYLKLLQVKNIEARDWYIREAVEEGWSVRTLQRRSSRKIVSAPMPKLTVDVKKYLGFWKPVKVFDLQGKEMVIDKQNEFIIKDMRVGTH